MSTSPARSRVFQLSSSQILLVTMLGAGLFLVGRLSWAGGNPSAIADIGRQYTQPGASLPAGLIVRRKVGYDGQFYYRLALKPYTTARTEFGLKLDQPSRRQQRILYPGLAWILSGGGQSRAVAWVLILINLVSYGVVSWLGVLLVRQSGRSPPSAFLFVGTFGLLLALAFDTSEALAIALLLGAILSLRAARFGAATTLLVLALLARETTLVLSIGVLLAILWGLSRKTPYQIGTKRVPFHVALVPIAVYVGWQVSLWIRWGKPAFTSTDGSDLGLPFAGIARAVHIWIRRGQTFDNSLFLAVSIALIALGLLSLRRSGALLHEKMAFAILVVIVCLFQWTVLVHYASYLRAFSEAFVLASLIILEDQRRNIVPLGVVWAGFWGWLFVEARVIG
jgi:hypothetical protein